MKIKKMDVVIPATLESNVIELHQFLYGEEHYHPSATVKKISDHIAEVSGVTKPLENAEEAGTGGGTVRKKDKKQEEKSTKKEEKSSKSETEEKKEEHRSETEKKLSETEESSIEVKKEVEKETENEEGKATEENSLGPAGDIGKKTVESSEENAENP